MRRKSITLRVVVWTAPRDYEAARETIYIAADQLEIYLKLMPSAGDATRTREAIRELRSEKKSSGS